MVKNPVVQGYVDRRVAAAEGRRPFDAALRREEPSELTALADAVFRSPDPVAAMKEYEAAVDAAEDELVAEMAAEAGTGFTRRDVRESAWALVFFAAVLSALTLWATT